MTLRYVDSTLTYEDTHTNDALNHTTPWGGAAGLMRATAISVPGDSIFIRAGNDLATYPLKMLTAKITGLNSLSVSYFVYESDSLGNPVQSGATGYVVGVKGTTNLVVYLTTPTRSFPAGSYIWNDAGNYAGPVTAGVNVGVYVYNSGSPTGGRIRIIGTNDAWQVDGTRAVIDASGCTRGLNFNDSTASYWDIQNIEIKNSGAVGFMSYQYSILYNCRATNCATYGFWAAAAAAFTRCEAVNGGARGFYLAGSGSVIECVSRANGTTGVETASSYQLISDNLIVDNNTDGIKSVSWTVVTHNVIHNNGGNGISQANVVGGDIRYNRITNNGLYGINIGAAELGSVEDYNTLYGNRAGGYANITPGQHSNNIIIMGISSESSDQIQVGDILQEYLNDGSWPLTSFRPGIIRVRQINRTTNRITADIMTQGVFDTDSAFSTDDTEFLNGRYCLAASYHDDYTDLVHNDFSLRSDAAGLRTPIYMPVGDDITRVYQTSGLAPGIASSLPDRAMVRSGVAYGDMGGLVGALSVPAAAEVLSGVAVGDATGTVVLPEIVDVRDGTTFGPSYSSRGSLRLPTADQVLAGVVFDGDSSGIVILPDTSDVSSGVHYGAGGDQIGLCHIPTADRVLAGTPVGITTGTLVQPDAADVRAGTLYGPGSTISGLAHIPGSSQVVTGVMVDDTIGTLILPAADQVLAGVRFAGTRGTLECLRVEPQRVDPPHLTRPPAPQGQPSPITSVYHSE